MITNHKIKLVDAQVHLENIFNLIKDNEWEYFMVSHLMAVKVEIERQLSVLKSSESK